MTVPLAHAGHWLANTLYALPAIVLVLALVRQRLRDRHRPELRSPGGDRRPEGSNHEPDPPE